METGGVDLADLVVAGDHTAWALEDWAWDPKAMLASAAVGAVRASKRRCSGLQTVSLYEADTLQSGAAQMQSPCCGASFGQAAATQDANSREDSQEKSAGNTEASEAVSRGGPPICQVEGCGRDVSSLSTYFQRCHICEIHIKEPQFLRQGILQRFCQQCGRCHELSAFQGSKRSCRDQLAKHNARRRRRTDKKAAGQRINQTSSPGISSSPCQARLADAFASLDANFVESLPSGSLTDEALSVSAGFSFPAAAYAPASFPVASLAFAADSPPAQSFQPSARASEPSAEDAQLLHSSTEIPAMSSPGVPALSNADIQQESPPAPSIALGIPVASSELANLAPHSSSFDMARALLATEAPPEYQSDNLSLRLSIKLFNCTPAELPPGLKQQLTGWLESTPLGAEGYLRPGCVHLILQAHVRANATSQLPKEALQALLAHLSSQDDPLWEEKLALIDLNGQLALRKGGQLVTTWDLTSPRQTGDVPEGLSVSRLAPLATSNSAVQKPCQPLWPSLHTAQPAAVFAGNGGAQVQLSGERIGCTDCDVLCRSHGRYYKISLDAAAACCIAEQSKSEASESQSVTIGLPAVLRPGMAWLEAHKGCMLSRAVPVLVCESRSLADELASWASPRGTSGEAMLADVGLLMSEEPSTQLHQTAFRLAEYAASADLPELLAFVATHSPAATVAAARPGEMCLLHACIKHGSNRALKSLLPLWELQVDFPGPGGVTPLHLAALRGDADAVKLLLDHGSPLAWTISLTSDGLSPAEFAKRGGHSELDTAMRLLSRIPVTSPASVEQSRAEGEPEQHCIVEIDSQMEEESPMLGTWPDVSKESSYCVTWPGPLGGAAPWGPAAKWSNVTLLGAVACMCTCVVLLRAWV